MCEELNVHGSFYARDDWCVWADDRWSEREINNTGVQPCAEYAFWYVREGVVRQNPPHIIMCMGNAPAISEIESRLSTNPRLVTYRVEGHFS